LQDALQTKARMRHVRSFTLEETMQDLIDRLTTAQDAITQILERL
jgi:hypothetical protein